MTASTLYEAVALGLVAVRGDDWVGDIPEGLNSVDVSVMNVPLTHSVRIQDFNKWLTRTGGTPRETANRNRIRAILGMAEKSNL